MVIVSYFEKRKKPTSNYNLNWTDLGNQISFRLTKLYNNLMQMKKPAFVSLKLINSGEVARLEFILLLKLQNPALES